MEFPTLVHLIRKALDADRQVEFMWHGGEPLLMGRDFFRKALWLQARLATAEHRINNALQTNGTLVDDAWCHLFRRFGIQVGVSLDGPRSNHDISRRKANGTGSYDEVLGALARLDRHGVHAGALIVLTTDLYRLGPRALLEWAKSIGLNSFGLLPVRPNNRDLREGKMLVDDFVDQAAYTSFLEQLYDIWRQDDDREFKIREIDSIVQAIQGRAPTVCMLSANCAGRYFTVEPDGSVGHCDKYVGDSSYRIGNIRQVTVEQLRQHPGTRAFARQIRAWQESCRRHCRWYDLCHGGCPHDRYVEELCHGEPVTPESCQLAGLMSHIAYEELPVLDALDEVVRHDRNDQLQAGASSCS